ncbi:DUF2203 domain-containing protein [Algisphaera agarilytica]|uniref:DUF2203 family protein n=1 Tax=Algisphaera agarilytica TaxID=1385975 RepID=A0A7X0H5N5_9BACT|nr:DUF2203 domain-containing protein [Algisphaera agarilytica]MBB6428586.1 hypothetical protein [Algisphaera agarilytica]
MFDPTVVPAVNPPRPGRKYFSVDEANRALPYISRVAVDITEVYSQVIELRSELENLDEGDLRNLTEREYETTMDRLGGLVDELHLAGVELRDFELGRIDFPAVYDNQEIMLAWQTGETSVGRWYYPENDDDEHFMVDSLIDNEAA